MVKDLRLYLIARGVTKQNIYNSNNKYNLKSTNFNTYRTLESILLIQLNLTYDISSRFFFLAYRPNFGVLAKAWSSPSIRFFDFLVLDPIRAFPWLSLECWLSYEPNLRATPKPLLFRSPYSRKLFLQVLTQFSLTIPESVILTTLLIARLELRLVTQLSVWLRQVAIDFWKRFACISSTAHRQNCSGCLPCALLSFLPSFAPFLCFETVFEMFTCYWSTTVTDFPPSSGRITSISITSCSVPSLARARALWTSPLLNTSRS
jgi:hypothetical protein